MVPIPKVGAAQHGVSTPSLAQTVPTRRHVQNQLQALGSAGCPGKKSPMGGATISFWHVLVWGIVRPWLSCVGNTCRARSAATVLPLAHPLLMHPYVMYVRDIQRSGDAEAMLGARSACAEWGCGCQPPAVPKPRKIPTPAFTGPQRTRPSAPLQLP